MLTNDDAELDAVFQNYRSACPDIDVTAEFMPTLWRKIESRRTFGFVFARLSRTLMGVAAAVCLLLLVLNLTVLNLQSQPAHQTTPTYMDALMADHTAEKTYYTEALRSAPPSDELPQGFEKPGPGK